MSIMSVSCNCNCSYNDQMDIGYDNPTNISMDDSMDTWIMQMNEVKIEKKFKEIDELYAIQKKLIENIEIQKQEAIQDKQEFEQMLEWLKTEVTNAEATESIKSDSDSVIGYEANSMEFYDNFYKIDNIYALEDMIDEHEKECFIDFDETFDTECYVKKHKTISDVRTVFMAIKSHKGSHNASKKDKLKMSNASKPDRTKSAKAKKVSRIIRARN